MSLMLVVALLLLLISGAILFSALILSRRVRVALEQRVSLVHANLQHASGPAIVASKTPIDTTPLSARLCDFFTLGISHTWGMRAKPLPLLMLGGLAALLAYLGVELVLGMSYWVAAPAAAVCFFLLPRFLLTRQQAKADRKFTDLFPDAVDMVVRMLRAGLPITAAIRTIGTDAPPPISGVFLTLADQVDIGMPFDEALAITGMRVDLPDFRFFSIAVALQRATGGNLAETLEIISDIMRKRRAVRLKAQSTTAEVRISAYILGALPFFVVGALLLIQPNYLAPLITDPRGKFLAGGALASLAMAFITMRQMMRSAVRM